MVELADIVRIHGSEYIEKFGGHMPAGHQHALRAIVSCRTEALGGHVEQCDDDDCGHHRYAYHSCKDRNCPKCHGSDTNKWIAKRRKELLSVPYFHVTITIPQQLRRLARSHQDRIYSILMGTAAEALQKLGHDPTYVGGQLAILAVLHTWTRTLEHHPHVHMLVPAGGLDADGRWRRARKKKCLVCEKALSKLFRGKFMARLKKQFPEESFPKELWQTDWVVKIKPPIKNPKKVLDYLGRYVHRIAIANSRILSLEDGIVTFRYQVSDTRQWNTMKLPAEEFLRRYLQHVLPQRFHKVRYFGLWSPANRRKLAQIQTQMAENAEPASEDETAPSGPAAKRCPCCGKGIMVVIEVLPPKARSPPWQGMKRAERKP
ncbi:MAG: IS91 family transposase [Geobacter sp.]|nr:MAG: IS91 family transposase [Geobacter sp.]